MFIEREKKFSNNEIEFQIQLLQKVCFYGFFKSKID